MLQYALYVFILIYKVNSYLGGTAYLLVRLAIFIFI